MTGGPALNKYQIYMMGKPIKTIVYLSNSNSSQNAQVYTGLGLLQHKKVLKLYLKNARNKESGGAIECEFEGQKAAFEMHDRDTYLDKSAYQWCDAYFKRSATNAVMQLNNKMLPWGLNLGITSRHDLALKRAFYNFSGLKSVKKYVKDNFFLSSFLRIKNGAYGNNLGRLQQKPLKSGKPNISFSARLWEPGKNLGEGKNEDRHHINKERVDFVRALKKNFDGYYFGGIEDSAFARKLCPDLIIPARYTSTANYIKSVKQCSIGIATPGLLGSIGWKFSEYLLLSKAVVSNVIENTVLPHPCIIGVNYLGYTCINTMLVNVEKLLRDEDLRFSMM